MADVASGTLLIPSGAPGLPGPRGEQGPPGPAGSEIYVGPIPPPEPHEIGDLWFDTNANQLRIWGVDLDWILTGGMPVPLPVQLGGTHAENAADARANLGAIGESPDDGFIYARRGSDANWQGLTRPNDTTVLGEGSLTAVHLGWNTVIGADAAALTQSGNQTVVGAGALAAHVSNAGHANTVVGAFALAGNTAGMGNTVVGGAALEFAQGNHNIAIGMNAGRLTGGLSLSAVENSIIIGTGAAAQANGQTNQIVIGTAATGRGSNTATIGNADVTQLWLGNTQITPFPEAPDDGFVYARRGSNATWQGLTRPNDNVVLGEWALDPAPFGEPGGGNVAVGTGSLRIATSDSNTALGNWAFTNLISGNDSIAIGNNAAASRGSDPAFPQTLTNATNSVFIGTSTRALDDGQTNQIVIGYQAYGRGSNTVTIGNNDITGFYSSNLITIHATGVAIGRNALAAITTGEENVALGVDALAVCATGWSNIAIGYRALAANNSSSNVAVGSEALMNNTGQSNTAVGNTSLRSNTSGGNNSALGRDALWGNTSGGSNTAVGWSAMAANTTGSANTALGMNAGRNFGGATGLTNPVTLTNNSIFIGFQAGPQADDQTNQIVIGYNAVGRGSNTATIGNAEVTQLWVGNAQATVDPTTAGNFLRTNTGTWVEGVTPPGGAGFFVWQRSFAAPVTNSWTSTITFTGGGGAPLTITNNSTTFGSGLSINNNPATAAHGAASGGIAITNQSAAGRGISILINQGTGLQITRNIASPHTGGTAGIRFATNAAQGSLPVTGQLLGNIIFAGPFRPLSPNDQRDVAAIVGSATANWVGEQWGPAQLEFRVTAGTNQDMQTAVTIHANRNVTVAGQVLVDSFQTAPTQLINLQTGDARYLREAPPFPEAPDDGYVYGRRGADDGEWVRALPLSGGTLDAVIDATARLIASVTGTATGRAIQLTNSSSAGASSGMFAQNTGAGAGIRVEASAGTGITVVPGGAATGIWIANASDGWGRSSPGLRLTGWGWRGDPMPAPYLQIEVDHSHYAGGGDRATAMLVGTPRTGYETFRLTELGRLALRAYGDDATTLTVHASAGTNAVALDVRGDANFSSDVTLGRDATEGSHALPLRQMQRLWPLPQPRWVLPDTRANSIAEQTPVFTRIMYGNGVFLATVSALTGGSPAATSTDGVTWTAQDNFPRPFVDLTFTNDRLVAVAVSNALQGPNAFGESSDNGLTWTLTELPSLGTGTQPNPAAIAWGNGRYVIVTNRVLSHSRSWTSTDGVNWTTSGTLSDVAWRSVCFANGMFVAVGSDGVAVRVMTSTNGSAWTNRPSPGNADNGVWHSVCFGNGRFVAVGRQPATGHNVVTSDDGITWTLRGPVGAAGPQPTDFWHRVIYSDYLGLFIATNSAAPFSIPDSRVMSSPDGITWTRHTTPALPFDQIASGNQRVVAVTSDVGMRARRAIMSFDAVNWTIRNTPILNPCAWQVAASGTAGSQFIVLANGGDRALRNQFGTGFGNVTLPANSQNRNWRGACFGNNRFVAVASSGAGFRAMTSTDGGTWVSRETPADFGWRSVTFGNGLFVAVADTGTGNRIMTSPDGITWELQTQPSAQGWGSVTFGDGIFVAVSFNQTMRSLDGITWTQEPTPAGAQWNSVCYGNGLFVAVSQSGTNRVMTSPDGITWAVHSVPVEPWQSVSYGNGIFVATGATFGSDDGQVMVSPDGRTWSLQNNVPRGEWRAVAFHQGVNRFMAVSPIGEQRVMTWDYAG